MIPERSDFDVLYCFLKAFFYTSLFFSIVFVPIATFVSSERKEIVSTIGAAIATGFLSSIVVIPFSFVFALPSLALGSLVSIAMYRRGIKEPWYWMNAGLLVGLLNSGLGIGEHGLILLSLLVPCGIVCGYLTWKFL
jgi:hypothetical protein